jgi:seryl-tRNA synthetase
LKVGLLGKDIEQISELNDKLSDSIEKIREMNANMIRMITIHEQRHEQHEKIEDDLREDIKELHSRITTVNREIHDRIDQVERTITQRLDVIRQDLIKHRAEDEPKVGKVLKEIDQYKWMILGAAIVVGWLIGHIDMSMVGKLLK